jgi:hypothetical protein
MRCGYVEALMGHREHPTANEGQANILCLPGWLFESLRLKVPLAVQCSPAQAQVQTCRLMLCSACCGLQPR